MSDMSDMRQAVLTMAGEREKAKPLRWRTGPVPEGLWVFYMWFLDGAGVDYEIGEGRDDGNIGGNFTTEWENAQWLPLSEILELIGE